MKKKIVSFFILILIIVILFWILDPFKLSTTKSDSYRYNYAGTVNYPGYKERIDALKVSHPNWNFIIMDTGLDWNDAIANEYTGHHTSPKNLIQGKTGGWICSICGEEVYDTGNWMCASEATIRYYMDTRNWLVDSPYLFQFLQTDYMDTSDNDVYTALNGTFLYSMENASLINRVCKEKNASPYFIIARIIQEQGTAGGITYKMQDSDGTYYYNLFNIGASGNGDEVYTNALNKAKSMGWDTLEKSISGGISFILSSYISYKQNTLYLNKFDVETYMGTYVKQYMQNIEAPKTEAVSMYNRMKTANLLNKNLTFVIPVYENMPDIASYSPDTIGELYPKNIRVKEGHSGITVRSARSTTASIIGRINDSSDIVLSVERFSDGWHKVVLIDGTTGYVKFNTDYLEEVNDIVNCYENLIINYDDAILRVGPGIGQTEITSISKETEIVRIDNTGRYNFGGKIWDRIMLKDGRQGFISREYLEDITSNQNVTNNVSPNQNITNNIASNQNVINDTAINQNIINNETANNSINDISLNQIENNNLDVEENNNANLIENSDTNITKNNNIENITEINNQTNLAEENNIANENENIIEQNIESSETTNQISENNSLEENKNYNIVNEINQNLENTTNSNTTIEDDTAKQERKYLIIPPNKVAKDLDGIVTKNGIETDEAGTGYKISINNIEYTIVKRGDANGDGYVKANDYLIIKDYIMGNIKANLLDEYLQAADVTNDKFVKANDYLKIKDHIMYNIDL